MVTSEIWWFQTMQQLNLWSLQVIKTRLTRPENKIERFWEVRGVSSTKVKPNLWQISQLNNISKDIRPFFSASSWRKKLIEFLPVTVISVQTCAVVARYYYRSGHGGRLEHVQSAGDKAFRKSVASGWTWPHCRMTTSLGVLELCRHLYARYVYWLML